MQINVGSGISSRFGGQSAGGKGCLTVFFLIFLGMGSIFAIVILGEAVRTAAVWFWPEAECTVIASGVEETGDDQEPYTAAVVFEYLADGRSIRGTRLTRSPSASSSYDTARRAADTYPPGTRASCRINPDDSGDAVLERRLPFVAFVVFFPLIFVAVGAGGLYFTWKASPGPGKEAADESISQRARSSSTLGRKIGLGIGLLFAVVGGALTIFLLVVPGLGLLEAADWKETPATIAAATLRSWSTDDGTSFRADILYEYSAAGRLWLSNRRTFFPMSSSDYDDARATVDRYPEAGSTVCFIDPNDPSRSVLDRSFGPTYLIGLFPLVFLFAGLGLIIHTMRARDAGAARAERQPVQVAETGSQRTLEPEAGPIAKIVAMTLIAVFWNGIVSVFVWQAVKAVQSGNPEWFMMIFLTPFVLVGLALIVGIFYTILAAFNPRPILSVSPASPRLGTPLRVDWSFKGKVSRIQQLKIVLEGHEKATYRRGTDTYTDREAFASFELAASSLEWEIGRGSAEVTIPEDTMHSFASVNNGVIWSLIVEGAIPRWPDVSESFEIEVRPMAPERLVP